MTVDFVSIRLNVEIYPNGITGFEFGFELCFSNGVRGSFGC